MTDLQQQCEYLVDNLPGLTLGWPTWSGSFEGHLTTGDGTLEIIEAMRKLGYLVSIDSLGDEDSGKAIRVALSHNTKDLWNTTEADTIPEAVIQAAYSALKGVSDE